MKQSKLTRHIAGGLLCCAAALAGCVGGGETEVAGIDRGGVRGGVSVGVVTGFGSIYVNGIRYATDAATIVVDGQTVGESGLALGQVAAVTADIADAGATATAVNVDSKVIGPVSAVDAGAGTLIVLGQSVVVSVGTYLDAQLTATGLAGLAPGTLVRVSGLTASDDSILATRVEVVPAVADFILLGTVRELDANQQRLRIGDQYVDYSSAAMISGFAGGEPRTGDVVKVTSQGLDTDGVLVAESLTLRAKGIDGNEGDEVEVEGLITALVSAANFEVANVPVVTTAQTEYSGGNAGNLVLNARIEVEGRLDAVGAVVARKIEFRREGNIEIEAEADAVDAQAGTVELLGITVYAQGLTNLSAIQPGRCLKVKGYASAAQPGQLIATRLETEDSCSEAKLQAVVIAASNPTFEMFGVTVQTDGSTSFDGISEAAFYATAVGREVEVEGIYSGGTLFASEVEIED